mgnify:CR=1 FL=1
MTEQLDKDSLIGLLMLGYISPRITGSEKKKLAVERYMRAYLRSLTCPELASELEDCEHGIGLSSAIVDTIAHASDGYDAFMAKRNKVKSRNKAKS